MPTISELLENWQATDILEHWDEFTTIQAHRHKDMGLDVVVHIIRCEMCRTPLWLYMKKENGSMYAEHKLTNTCLCDEELDDFLGDNPPEDVESNELPGMWDRSDFM